MFLIDAKKAVNKVQSPFIMKRIMRKKRCDLSQSKKDVYCKKHLYQSSYLLTKIFLLQTGEYHYLFNRLKTPSCKVRQEKKWRTQCGKYSFPWSIYNTRNSK